MYPHHLDEVQGERCLGRLPDRLILTITNGDSGQSVNLKSIEWPAYSDPGSRASFVDMDGCGEM